jgi:DNA-binding GntR family transcriptional regulator
LLNNGIQYTVYRIEREDSLPTVSTSRGSTVHEELGYRSFSDFVFNKLKQAILNGTLKPGERLRQIELSRKYGVSRAPVRDAISRLAGEGLVTINGATARVSAVSLEEFLEVYRIRESLETLAARLSFPNASEETVIYLTHLVEEMELASSDGNLPLWLELNRKFHLDSYASCNSPILLKMISGLWDSTDYCRRRYITLTGNLEHANQGHRAILEALSKRDARLYMRLCREHIDETSRTVKQMSAEIFDTESPPS